MFDTEAAIRSIEPFLWREARFAGRTVDERVELYCEARYAALYKLSRGYDPARGSALHWVWRHVRQEVQRARVRVECRHAELPMMMPAPGSVESSAVACAGLRSALAELEPAQQAVVRRWIARGGSVHIGARG